MRLIYVGANALAVFLTFAPACFGQKGGARLGGPLVDGSVTRARGCGSRFFVAYHESYAQLQWLGGQAVIDGDVLHGSTDQDSFEREGQMTFLDLATNATIQVFVDRALMSRADYAKALHKLCR